MSLAGGAPVIRLCARIALICLYETGCIEAFHVNAPAAVKHPGARPTRSEPS